MIKNTLIKNRVITIIICISIVAIVTAAIYFVLVTIPAMNVANLDFQKQKQADAQAISNADIKIKCLEFKYSKDDSVSNTGGRLGVIGPSAKSQEQCD